MLRVCDCDLSPAEAATLIGLLEQDVTVASDEAAAAIRFAISLGSPVDDVDPTIRDAVRQVLDHADVNGGLAELQTALHGRCC